MSRGLPPLDFSNITESGLKPLLTPLKKQIDVTDVEASNRASRRDGQQQKKATIYFADGQKATIFVTNDGDIFQVRINGSVAPFKAPRSFATAAKQLAQRIKDQSPAFKKKLAAKLKRASEKSTVKPASRSLDVRIKEARSRCADVTDNIKTLEERKGELETTVVNKEQEVSQLKAQYHMNEAGGTSATVH